MKFFEKSLLTISSAALITISCKNSGNNPESLKFRETQFSFTTLGDYTVNAHVNCTSNPLYEANQTITKTTQSLKVVENTNCTITISSISNNGIELTPSNNSVLEFNYNSTSGSSHNSSSDIVNFTNTAGAIIKFAKVINNTGSISLFLAESYEDAKQITANTQSTKVTSSSVINIDNIPAPETITLTLENKVLVNENNETVEQKVTLISAETREINNNNCKIVSATEWGKKAHNWTETNNLFKSINAKACPKFNEENNWITFKNETQYLILSNSNEAKNMNSYRVITINQVD